MGKGGRVRKVLRVGKLARSKGGEKVEGLEVRKRGKCRQIGKR